MKTKHVPSTPDLRKNSMLRRGISSCLIVVLMTSRVIACDFCLRLPNAPIDFDHPGAIEVALATHAAAEQGQIDLNPSLQIGETGDRVRTVRLAEISPGQLLAQWVRTRPARSHVALRCSVELIFVDVDFSCWLDVRLGEILVGDPNSGPADIRLTTTKAGFWLLLQSGLAKCEKRQLVAVESIESANHDGLSQLFDTRTKPIL